MLGRMKWRNTTFFEHSPDSPNERWGPGLSSMQRTVDVRSAVPAGIMSGTFGTRLQAAYDFLGYSVVLPGNASDNNGHSQFFIHRVTPMPYPGMTASFMLPAVPGDLPPNFLPPDLTTVIETTPGNRFWVVAISRTEPISPPEGANFSASPVEALASEYRRVRMTLECSTQPFSIMGDDALIKLGGVDDFALPDEGVALANGWIFTRYIQRQRQAFSRIIQIPYGMMQTQAPGPNGQTKLNRTAIPIREGGANITYTWMRVPLEGPPGDDGKPVSGFNPQKIGGMLNTINGGIKSNQFNPQTDPNVLPPVTEGTFDGFPPCTLFFDSYATREYQGAFGEWLADVTFNMIYMPSTSTGAALKSRQDANQSTDGFFKKGIQTGWNTVIDVDTRGAYDYYRAGTALANQAPFVGRDFSQLFNPNPYISS